MVWACPCPATIANSMDRLQGKKALITGASSGIGEAIAIRFAREGADVAINYRGPGEQADAIRVQAAAQASGSRVVVTQADVSDEAQVERMFADCIRELAGLDILVNNAGIQKEAPSHEVGAADFDRILAVNIRGPFLCSRAALRHFLSREGGGGVIVNNSSVHAIIPKPQYLSYAISKGGLENLTSTLALEYADRGIRVNAVGPGAVVTPINKAWTGDPKARAEVSSHIPLGRPAEADEIASVVAFLASDEASYVTGQTLYACGGLTLYPEFRTTWSS